jgi:uncharacterized glyoxalase superfamily protein PhnB
MYIQVTGIEGYYNRLVAAGLKPAIEIADRPYGMRDFRVVDPSGNELHFGEPLNK